MLKQHSGTPTSEGEVSGDCGKLQGLQENFVGELKQSIVCNISRSLITGVPGVFYSVQLRPLVSK